MLVVFAIILIGASFREVDGGLGCQETAVVGQADRPLGVRRGDRVGAVDAVLQQVLLAEAGRLLADAMARDRSVDASTIALAERPGTTEVTKAFGVTIRRGGPPPGRPRRRRRSPRWSAASSAA